MKPYTSFGLQSCIIMDLARTKTYSGVGSWFHFSHQTIMKYKPLAGTKCTDMEDNVRVRSRQRAEEDKIAI